MWCADRGRTRTATAATGATAASRQPRDKDGDQNHQKSRECGPPWRRVWERDALHEALLQLLPTTQRTYTECDKHAHRAMGLQLGGFHDGAQPADDEWLRLALRPGRDRFDNPSLVPGAPGEEEPVASSLAVSPAPDSRWRSGSPAPVARTSRPRCPATGRRGRTTEMPASAAASGVAATDGDGRQEPDSRGPSPHARASSRHRSSRPVRPQQPLLLATFADWTPTQLVAYTAGHVVLTHTAQ